jgi:hypothetical protein
MRLRDFCVTFNAKDRFEHGFRDPLRSLDQPFQIRRRVVRGYTPRAVPEQVLTILEWHARGPQSMAEGVPTIPSSE